MPPRSPAARLNNPHIVSIHTYGEIDGRRYVDMGLIESRDLQEVLADGPMNPHLPRMLQDVRCSLAIAGTGDQPKTSRGHPRPRTCRRKGDRHDQNLARPAVDEAP